MITATPTPKRWEMTFTVIGDSPDDAALARTVQDAVLALPGVVNIHVNRAVITPPTFNYTDA